MKLRQFDIVTIRGTVELPHGSSGGVQVLCKSPRGEDVRVLVGDDEVVSVEPGPLAAGAAVTLKPTKGHKAKGEEGTVVSVDGDHAWVRWPTGQSLEATSGLDCH